MFCFFAFFCQAVFLHYYSSYTFTPNVVATNNPSQSVDWSVSGGVVGTSINSDGVLTVNSNETSNVLIVRATSTFDNSKFATATVNVTQIPVIDAQIPSIITNPKSATVYVGGKVELSVFANITDGGDLSYQWYSNNINSNT